MDQAQTLEHSTDAKQTQDGIELEAGAMTQNQHLQNLKLVEPEPNPFGLAKKTEAKHPIYESNPIKAMPETPQLGPTIPSSEPCANTTGAIEQSAKRKREIIHSAEQAIRGFSMPLCLARGWEPLTDEEISDLAEPAVEILPQWLWHPVLRLVGATVRIVSRRMTHKPSLQEEAAK